MTGPTGLGGAGAMMTGVRIIDMTSVVFGPYCTQILADMGADVIKVEAPAGDVFRNAGVPAHTPQMGPCHMTLNRGKRSVVLDLKNPKDHATMTALLSGADIFIHNVRARAIGSLGFDYAACVKLKPDLIYVHCTGFGSDGPYAGLQAYDDVIQAATGMTTLPGRADGDPTPRYVPSTIADKVAGLHAAYAVLAAVVHRLRTGEGQHVEVPMFESFTQFLLEEHLFGATFDPPTGPVGYSRQIDPHRQPFPTSDGHISIVPYSEANWLRTFELLGRPEILADPLFNTPILRAQNVSLLYKAMAELTPARSTAEWASVLAEANIPAMPVRDIADILEDPHLVATNFFKPAQHPSEGAYRQTRPPVRFSARPDPAIGHAPVLGQHTQSVRAELGLAKGNA